MRPFRLLLAGLPVLLVLAASTLPVGTSAAPSTPQFINGVRDTGQFLPDTAWLVQVGPRVSTVGDYIRSYFDSYPEDRPNSDSLGRVKFLNSMIHKDVLGMSALQTNVTLGFEDRLTLREHRQRWLSNIVYQRLVQDSVVVTDEDVTKAGEQFNYDQHFRHILFDDRIIAERVRRDLLSGRIRWSDAVKRYTRATDDQGPDGDLGWATRAGMEPMLAYRLFLLKPGEMSSVFADRDGFQLVQALERRPRTPIAIEPLRNSLRALIADFRATERSERIQQLLRDRIAIQYDTTNMRFVASKFAPPVKMSEGEKGHNIEVSSDAPEFTPADTARVLATWKNGGRFTVQQLIRAYTDLTPMLRPNLTFFEAVKTMIDGIVLEPFVADYAVERGLDKDSLVVAELARKREQVLVEHMYQDSVASRIWVSKDERRAFYEKNKTKFVTYSSVDFAAIVRPNKKSADSLAAALLKGANAAAVLHADSLAGNVSGSIQHRSSEEKGPYGKILFEELRPGQNTVVGPDKQGTYMVLHLLNFDPGRQLSFEESDAMADESLQNIKAEQALNAFIERLSKKYVIRSRPELVMRIRLVDPTLR